MFGFPFTPHHTPNASSMLFRRFVAIFAHKPALASVAVTKSKKNPYILYKNIDILSVLNYHKYSLINLILPPSAHRH